MIPLTRHGWREMLVGSLVLVLIAWGLGLLWRPLALVALPFLIWLFAFFRDPERPGPADANAVVSPADGKVSDITEIEHDPLIGGPAVRVGIFLSVFNVHVNRAPCAGRVVGIEYRAGKFINAMKHGAASEQNESNTVVLAEPNGERTIMVVKQIVGLIARRIVCSVSNGEVLERGQRIGMIKFGSRTELTIAKWLEPTIAVKIGQNVRGAADVIAVLGKPVGSGAGEKIELRETPA
jgi:phosphatidylserine decarboxylase